VNTWKERRNGKQGTARSPEPSARAASPSSKRARAASRRAETAPLAVVGIGASAGGLVALERFFSNVPENSGLAFVVVTHLSPSHVSLLPGLVASHSALPCTEASDSQFAEPNHVYFIPPNKGIVISGGVLGLVEPPEPHGLRHPIDHFFESLAADQGRHGVAVVLSGTGTDGTAGVRSVRASMGLTVAQQPAEAEHGGMPSSAIDSGAIDLVLPAAEMPSEILAFVRRGRIGVDSTGFARRLPTETIKQICAVLLRQTGHDFSHYKQTTVERRCLRRMDLNQIDSPDAYVDLLKRRSEEAHLLFQDLVINVTAFFRDPDAFESLKSHLSARLSAKPADEAVRAWVQGCSTGEEAYSVAIVLRECLGELGRSQDIQVFGTDIDDEAIAVARKGAYPASISSVVGDTRLKRFFINEGGEYRIAKEIRDRVIFSTHDVLRDPPFSRLDLVSCRNVLIYMDNELQQKLFHWFHYALRPDGLLFLGTSETIGVNSDLFAPLDDKQRVYYRLPGDSQYLRHVFDVPAASTGAKSQATVPPLPRVPTDIAREAEQLLLESLAPACAVVDAQNRIVFSRGDAARYLKLSEGPAGLDILSMVPENVRPSLQSALMEARSAGRQVALPAVQLEVSRDACETHVVVQPLRGTDQDTSLAAVIFREVPVAIQSEAGSGRRRSKRTEYGVADLERQLSALRQELRATVESMAATTEELQSANEELQSSNEELETSREELQALNEEMYTLNSELQAKMEDLAHVNDDMRNLMDSTSIATIFVDKDIRIVRYTPDATKVFRLRDTDIGRPLSDLATELVGLDIESEVRAVWQSLASRERQVRTESNHWYLVRMVPYRTSDDVIAGVVVTFVDIDEQKRSAQVLEKTNAQLANALRYAEEVIDTVREPMLVLDQDLRVVSVNRAFLEHFMPNGAREPGSVPDNLGIDLHETPEMHAMLADVLADNRAVTNALTHVALQNGESRRVVVNARRIEAAGGQEPRILVTIVPSPDNADSSPVAQA